MIEVYAIDWLPSARLSRPLDTVGLDIGIRDNNIAQEVELSMTQRAKTAQIGYIAGSGNGLFTLNGTPSFGEILCMDVTDKPYKWIYRGSSFKNGHWLVDELDPNRKYLVMGRDYNKEYEPFCWDYVTPATDLTFEQQQELWQSWQTSP